MQYLDELWWQGTSEHQQWREKDLTHCGSFLGVLGALSVRKVKSRFHGSGARLTVCYTKSVQDVKATLPLGEPDGVLGTIPINLDP